MTLQLCKHFQETPEDPATGLESHGANKQAKRSQGHNLSQVYVLIHSWMQLKMNCRVSARTQAKGRRRQRVLTLWEIKILVFFCFVFSKHLVWRKKLT
jgi:hypothetical protein